MLPGVSATGMMMVADSKARIVSFSQSGNAGGTGIEVATVVNMSDGLFQPFAATPSSTDPFVTANLAGSAFVASIILGPSTATGGWGAQYLNGAALEISNDYGSSYSTVRTLSGYVNAVSAGSGTTKTEAIGAICTNIRIRRPGGAYVAVSEFKLSP